jgi:hypothetical protein
LFGITVEAEACGLAGVKGVCLYNRSSANAGIDFDALGEEEEEGGGVDFA